MIEALADDFRAGEVGRDMPLPAILENLTVDEKYVEDCFHDEEFQENMRRIKIIELKAELEAKRALLEALILEKQQVSLPRRACIPEELHPGQL